MAPGHSKVGDVIHIPLVQSFISAADYSLYLQMEFGIKLSQEVQEVIDLIDFKESYGNKLTAAVLDGGDFKPRTYLIRGKERAEDLGLNIPPPVITCLLYGFLLSIDSKALEGFKFLIPLHDEIAKPVKSKIELDEFTFLAINNEGNIPELIKFIDEPISGAGFIGKEDGLVFIK